MKHIGESQQIRLDIQHHLHGAGMSGSVQRFFDQNSAVKWGGMFRPVILAPGELDAVQTCVRKIQTAEIKCR